MEKMKVAIIGLGYVGLPLAHLFATKYPVIGFDVKQSRVDALKRGEDVTMEMSAEKLNTVLLPHLPESDEAGLFNPVIIILWQFLLR